MRKRKTIRTTSLADIRWEIRKSTIKYISVSMSEYLYTEILRKNRSQMQRIKGDIIENIQIF